MGYRENIDWEKSMLLVIEVHKFTESLPNYQKYILFQQMYRSAISIPSNIAEGYGRSTKLDYARFVDIALGSTRELQTQLEICERVGYGTTTHLVEQGEEVAKILYGLAKSLRK